MTDEEAERQVSVRTGQWERDRKTAGEAGGELAGRTASSPALVTTVPSGERITREGMPSTSNICGVCVRE